MGNGTKIKDPVFGFETVHSPLVAEDMCQKADKAWWENSWILAGVALAMAMLDMLFIFDMLDLVLMQNAMLGRIGAFGVALILNFLPLVIAKQVNKARYKLDNQSKLFAIIAITIFTLLYLVVVLLRFQCLELYTSTTTMGLTNTVNQTGASTLIISDEAKRRAFFTALLLSAEPLATSGFSFVLAIMTDNPIKKQINCLEKRQIELRSARNQVSTALASMLEDIESLIDNDLQQYNAAKEAVEADARRLQAESRMMLAEKLRDSSSITALSSSETS